MSTFDGIVREIPDIRIDHFRLQRGKPPPLACFLSHVHSDHLQGLESLKSPFVYCSAATKRLLLRMEKYPHRMNFAKGILESRKQHYKHLRLVLKALPLETPTELELGPKTKIRVTLFDANHCPGAVMFLIEGTDATILYTGDVRAEPWWVRSIARNPVLVPYTAGDKRLDCIYLDTTFATHEDVYRDFPTKASGLVELIRKVKGCSPDTDFYFRAWTLGYEDVWIALSMALGSKVHADEYQMRLYGSLNEESREGVSIAGGSALTGFQAGNHHHAGCLTHDANARIHSCEPGTPCHAELAKKKKVVWITPIISRTKDGVELRELGAGGGGGDLYQMSELEPADDLAMQAFAELCTGLIADPKILSKTVGSVAAMHGGRRPMSLQNLGLDLDAEISLKDFVRVLSRKSDDVQAKSSALLLDDSRMTSTIHFPYSRHSSYSELRDLVSHFRPKDVCACTVDVETWTDEYSMESLFGDLCSEASWYHDQQVRLEVQEKEEMMNLARKRKRDDAEDGETQREDLSNDQYETAQNSPDRETSSQKEAKRLPTTSDGLREAPVALPLGSGSSSVEEEQAIAHDRDKQDDRLVAVREAFRNINNGSDAMLDGGNDRVEHEPEKESQISLATTMFESQPQLDVFEDQEDGRGKVLGLQLDGGHDGPVQLRQSEQLFAGVERETKRSTRAEARKEAYKAARLCLRHNDTGEWQDLGSRAIGRSDHGEEEVEL